MYKRSLILLCLFITSGLYADEKRTISVSGTASTSQPADKAMVTIGITTENKNATVAANENNAKMQQLTKALNKVSLTEKDYQTSQYMIAPIYTERPKNPSPDWKSQIIGYRVNNRIRVETEKLEIIPRILNTATENGANIIEDIQFTLKDDLEAQNLAIGKAVHQAFSHAQAAGEAAKTPLLGVYEITVHPSMISPRFYKAERFALASSVEAPIAPGDIEVSATVTVVFEIESEELTER